MQDRVTMDNQETTSRSYLLRLWLAGSAGQAVWRASLENVQTGERLGFANLEHLFVFLMQQTEHYGEADAKSES
jgi:hypothetical protein